MESIREDGVRFNVLKSVNFLSLNTLIWHNVPLNVPNRVLK